MGPDAASLWQEINVVGYNSRVEKNEAFNVSKSLD